MRRQSRISPEVDFFDVDSYLKELDDELGINTSSSSNRNKSSRSSKNNNSSKRSANNYYNDDDGDDDDDDNGKYYNDKKKKNVNSDYYDNDDDDSKSYRSDNEGEEIKLTHELNNNSHEQLTDDIKRNFVELSKQVAEFRDKYQKAVEKLSSLEMTNEELREKVDTLEDDLHDAILNGGAVTNKKTIITTNVNNNNNNNNNKNAKSEKRNDDLRQAFLTHAMEDDFVDHVEKEEKWLAELFLSINTWINKNLPFNSQIQQIEAKFGTSVSCYFIFYRFIHVQFILTTLFTLLFTILHILNLEESKIDALRFGASISPTFMNFSSFQPKESFYYALMITVVTIITLVIVIVKVVREDRVAKDVDALDAENDAPYSKEILAIWDNSLNSQGQIDDFKNSFVQRMKTLKEELNVKNVIEARTNIETLLINLRRAAGLFLYTIIQSVSFAIIIYLTLRANDINNSLSGTSVAIIGQFLSPLCLSALNTITPILLVKVTDIERWDTGADETNVLLFRNYLSTILNTLLLALSYFLLADPVLLTDRPFLRNALDMTYSINYPCRMDHAADSLFTLVLSGFFTKNLFLWLTPVLMMVYARCSGEEFVKPGFNMSDAMVGLLSWAGLALLSFPFTPFGVLLMPFYIGISFRWEIYCYSEYYAKPKRPWKAQKAGATFILYYFVTVIVLLVLPVLYFMNTTTFPKDCLLQDDTSHLCLTGNLDSNNECVLDKDNIYYSFFQDSKYPKQICERACGPFIYSNKNFEPLLESIQNNIVLNYFWKLLFDSTYIPWMIIVVLAILLGTRKNTTKTMKTSSMRKINAMENNLHSLKAENRRQEKTIARLKIVGDKRHITND